jgi:hypothetical protein
MEFWTQLNVVAPPAKIAEQRLPDSGAIAVVTIFDGNFQRRDWRWSWFGRNHTGDQKPSRIIGSNVANRNILSVRFEVALPVY